MAVIKRIVVLANSIKNSGRCLAGKELIRKGGSYEVGSWIRVVGSEDGGEVSVSWMLEQLGRDPKLLDVIDVPLEAIVPLADQPENWLLGASPDLFVTSRKERAPLLCRYRPGIGNREVHEATEF